MFFGLFKRKSKSPVLILTPETDLELLNKRLCPDCGVSEWTECNDLDVRHIECIGCGSAFNVFPCQPPYLYVYHIGYNREGKRIQSQRQGKLSEKDREQSRGCGSMAADSD